MITMHRVDTANKKQVGEFVEFPFRLYKDCPLNIKTIGCVANRSNPRPIASNKKIPVR